VRHRFRELTGASALDGLAGRVQAGELDPYAAADELLAGLATDPDRQQSR
jgi:LAO/AO transport system kinase